MPHSQERMAELAEQFRRELETIAGVSVIEVKALRQIVIVRCYLADDADEAAALLGARYRQEYGILVDLRVPMSDQPTEQLRLGVVGYCPPTRFDEVEALRLVQAAFDIVAAQYPGRPITVVSGLTDVGVLAIAYREAARRGWRTAGIACEQAWAHPLFAVDERQIIGQHWGDESPTFLASIHALVRIGGGKQSDAETKACIEAGKPVFEYDLPALSD